MSHKLTALDFSPMTLPENYFADRFFVRYSSAATADFVALCAMASRIYEPYDPEYAKTCLKAAKVSYDFLAKNPEDQPPDQKDFKTGAYKTTDPDDRLWAAAEMWETTGEKIYLDDLETRIIVMEETILTNFDWHEVSNLGIFTYIMSQRIGKKEALVERIKKDIITSADKIAKTRTYNSYARPLGELYYWGCNGTVARQTIILYYANILTPKDEYINAALDAIGHLLGRNFYGRSYVTGVGNNPPLFPHDRRSSGDDIEAPWPGYLVGGGHSATGWVDLESDYRTNEIAINWNSALIFALSEFVKE